METDDSQQSNVSEAEGQLANTLDISNYTEEEMARHFRKIRGPWEVETFTGEEAHLHEHVTGCVKNRGHYNFIPIGQFTVDKLPPGCQDNDLIDLIQSIAKLTVLVSVKFVSSRRPETDPRTGMPDPYFIHKANGIGRSGTGFIWRVNIFPNDYDKSHTTCSCKECQYTPTPITQFAHIHIYTAAHVVYDSSEASDTTCHLFFDKGGTPKASNGVVTLSGMSAAWNSPNDDSCEMRYVTHDLELAAQLSKLETRWNSLATTVGNKYRQLAVARQKSPPEASSVADPKQTLAIIVSHPHGCSKQVSIGHYSKRIVVDGRGVLTYYTYNVATCHGSSGAKVLIVEAGSMMNWYSNHVHGGNCKDSKEYNYSGIGFEGSFN